MNSALLISILCTCLILKITSNSNDQINPENPLEQFRWQKRVLLVCMPSASDPYGKEQLNRLEDQQAGLAERDLLLILIVGNQIKLPGIKPESATTLRQVYKVKPTAFAVVLVGKDGSEKYRSSKVADPAEIFRIIDAMPMRQSEIKKQ